MAAYSPAYIQKLIAECSSAKGNHAKGEAMADLVEYVFTEIPGVTALERSYLAADGSGEIDFIFSNDPFTSRLWTSGVTLFVECKNENRKIGAAQVRIFASKMGEHNQRLGVMVTRKGLSGKPTTAAHKVVSGELGQGRTIVVITIDDIGAFTTTDDLVRVFRERQEELEFKGHYTSI